MSTGIPTNIDTELGRLVVEQGLATSEEVHECMAQQRATGEEASQRSLADLLIANGVITERQIHRVRQQIDAQRSSQQIPGYQILEKLGSGAMATVYKARQLSLDRIVAIKILPKKFMSDPQFVDRFYAEGRAAAKLNHPNIVQAIDVGRAGEFHYFVMEYVEGHTVYDHLVEQGRYAEDRALDVIIQIAGALSHAHEQGFIHRDVKPKNIMITRNGVAKLADMGLARQVTDRDAAEAEAGRAYGTPYYISPEQIRGVIDIDFRADIYGLGATFYHMVTGQVPFEGPNPSAVMHKHLKEQLVPPDHVNPDLSAGVSEIIEVMMAKLRDDRYVSTTDLLEDLKAVAGGQPPLHARRKYNLASLASMEANATVELASTEIPKTSLLEQPMFWVAVGSVVLNFLLIMLLIVTSSG